jgi:hypothetical protein
VVRAPDLGVLVAAVDHVVRDRGIRKISA